MLLVSSEKVNPSSYARLKVLEETNDGFRIAEEDLKIRGPGELLGVRQSGVADFRIADLLKDRELLVSAREDAMELVESDPLLMLPRNRNLKELLEAKGIFDRLAYTESG